MMYTINYSYIQLGKPVPVKHVGATVELAKRTVIKFAKLEDAFVAAKAVETAGAQGVFVSNTEDPDARYLIPRNPT